MRFERDAHQREAESRAVVLRREVRLEHALVELGGNAGTVIGDGDGEAAGSAGDGHVDGAAALHRFRGVAVNV